jgi:hypothetical protein
MRSSKMAIDRQGDQSFLASLACALTLVFGVSSPPAYGMNIGAGRVLGVSADQSKSDVIEIRAVARGGRVAVGPRGGVAVRRTTVVRPGVGPVVRPGYAGGGVRWARPGRYYWPRGGAIAAGAAIGVVTAATAAAWAGAAPAPGMCWYYTDPSRTQGFWDYCQ